jgi:hypothetical protein
MIAKRHLFLLLTALLGGLCVSCGEDGGTEPDGGSLFEIELEDYSSSFDGNGSEVAIQKVACSNASNGSAVYGLDFAGEWIEVSVTVPESGTYRPHLQYAARAGANISLRMEMNGCGASATVDFLLTQGTGIG